MKRFFCVSLCLAGVFSQAADSAQACPPVAVQSAASGAAVVMPATVGVQTLCVPGVQTQAVQTVQTLAIPTVQTLAVPTVQVQTLTVPTTVAAPVVVQQVIRQRPVRIRSRTVTRTGFGLGLF